MRNWKPTLHLKNPVDKWWHWYAAGCYFTRADNLLSLNNLSRIFFQTSISAILQHPSRLSWVERNIGRINGAVTGRSRNIFCCSQKYGRTNYGGWGELMQENRNSWTGWPAAAAAAAVDARRKYFQQSPQKRLATLRSGDTISEQLFRENTIFCLFLWRSMKMWMSDCVHTKRSTREENAAWLRVWHVSDARRNRNIEQMP